MESYEQINNYSNCIYNILKKKNQNDLKEEEYELLNSLLREIYQKEETYLGNMDSKSFQDLIIYIKETFGFTFSETIYEVLITYSFELPVFRTYQRVKTEYDRRRFSSLFIKEENSFVENEMIKKMKDAQKCIFGLDFCVHRYVKDYDDFTLQYLFSSFSYPFSSSFTFLENLFLKEDTYLSLDYEYSFPVVQSYLFSFIHTFLKTSNLKYLEYFKYYITLIPDDFYEELVQSLESQYASIQHADFSSKDLDSLNQVFLISGLRKMNLNNSLEAEETFKSELLQFSYSDIVEFDSIFSELYSFSSAILNLMYQIYQSKINHENREARELLFIKLVKLNQVENEFLDKVSNVELFQKYIMICNDTNFVTLPFQLYDVALEILNSSKDLSLVKRLIRDRVYSKAMLLKENQSSFPIASDSEVLVIDHPVHSIGDLFNYLLSFTSSVDSSIQEPFCMDRILVYQDQEMYRYFKEHLTEENQSLYYLMMYLLLYRDPSILTTLIKQDFEYDYSTIAPQINLDDLLQVGEILHNFIELACEESLEREKPELFMAYLKTFEPFLSKEMCQTLLDAYEGTREEFKRERKRRE